MARVRSSRSRLDGVRGAHLAGHSAARQTLPAGVPGVGRAGNRAAVVDAELRRYAKHIETDFLAVCELVQEVMTEGYYARYGFVDAARYLEDRLGLSYRSVRRRFAIVEALRALPAGEQPAAREMVAGLGAMKASVLAPALKSDPTGWRDWAKKAAAESVEALQARVTTALGLKPRGAESPTPGARWLAHTLNLIDGEDAGKRAEVEEAFQLGYRIGRTDNALRVFLQLVEECIQEWRLRIKGGVE